MVDGAHIRTRTGDLLLTMQMLYQLSYVGRYLKTREASHLETLHLMERETGFEPATLSLEG